MERERTEIPNAEEVDVEDMNTTHGDKLQDAVDKVAEPSKKHLDDGVRRVDEEDMDTRGHGDPKKDLSQGS